MLFCNVHYVIVQDDIGETPLFAAVNEGQTHIVELLVEHQVNVNYRNKVRP